MSDDLFCSVDGLLDEDFTHKWLIEHLLPTGAGLLFHGKRGTGKSLLAMALAISVLNEGRLFSSWQTRRSGGVLYVQADLPPVLQQDRIKRLVTHFPWLRKQDLYFYFPVSLDITSLDEDDYLTGELREAEPCLVVWDVLRKIYHGQEAVHIPAQVYGAARSLFPDAAHFYIHHDRKTTKDKSEGFLDPAEDFSGVGPWLDLVTTGWHLEEETRGQFGLTTTKNNCGPEQGKILLRRDPETLMPVLRMPRIADEISRWKSWNIKEGEKLTRGAKEELKRYLLSSFVGVASTIDKVVEAER